MAASTAKACDNTPPSKSGATRAEDAGNITPAQAATIRHRADHVLGEKDSTYHNK